MNPPSFLVRHLKTLMASYSILAFLITLLISLLISAAAAHPAIPSLIHKACSQTASNLQKLCISSLSAEPPSANADLRLLSIISVRIAANNASQTAAYLSAQQTDAAASGAIDPMLYQCVADCTDLYVDVAEQLDVTTAAIDDEADKDAMIWLNAAMADVISCEKGCGAVATAEIRRRNDGAKKLLNITISFTKLLMAPKGL
ncbi:Cell wall / vacuolar inhibitor of fructosidase 2 [Dendrobium catenatum]|uniref:Cell wall / vacuolar inhibitor of fructosidase 2 n=2 Tax=Dendrobium catenatum TaxID=906689 RepID=A0A2I0VTQ0_9ASPA|nr:Cell wall / vacuolar inhibitor of fructosidase 2 [Dendrobium catenatum]